MPAEPAWTKINDLICCGKLPDALSTALEDFERTKSDDDESHYLALSRLAMVYKAQCRYEQAIVALQKVARFVSEKYGETHPYYFTIICRLAENCLGSDRVDDASVFVSKALQIVNHFGGETVLQYPLVLSLQAHIRQKEGDLASAESLHIRSLRFRSRYFSKIHPEFAYGLYNLAIVYIWRGRSFAARRLLDRLLRMLERGECANEPLYAMTLREAVTTIGIGGDLVAAHESIGKALDLFARRSVYVSRNSQISGFDPDRYPSGLSF